MSGGISPIYSPCNWARLTKGEADLSSISSSNFVFFKEIGDIYKRISLPVNHCVQCIPAVNHNKHTSGIIILSNGAPTLQTHSFSHQLQAGSNLQSPPHLQSLIYCGCKFSQRNVGFLFLFISFSLPRSQYCFVIISQLMLLLSRAINCLLMERIIPKHILF